MTNKCINCGCEDAYPSLPAFPSPDPCANPQPCAEVFDAQCVSYTLPDILCGDDIVIAQDSTIAAALESIVLFMCSNITSLQECCDTNTLAIANLNLEVSAILSQLGGLVQSVTGLDTDNTDPLNPVVRIAVDGVTITGLGTPANPLVATGGGIAGSGTLNYVARWTPDGNTLGTGLIRDNGTTTGVGSNVGYLSALFSVDTQANNHEQAITARSSHTSTTQKNAIFAISEGSGIGENVGYYANVSGSSTINYGAKIYVNQGTNQLNIGIYTNVGILSPGTGIAYCAQLQDGTEGIGKVLTCMTADGKANWETTNKQKEITTSNYVLTNADNDYTIFINNGATAISISLGAITIPNFCVGFIQEGSADVTFSGVTNPVGLKSKGQGYQTFVERKLSTSTYYLLGNTKA